MSETKGAVKSDKEARLLIGAVKHEAWLDASTVTAERDNDVLSNRLT